MKKLYNVGLLIIFIGYGSLSFAAVSEDQAKQLGSELTPLGAVRSANVDGIIPEWTGSYDLKVGDIPFDGEDPIFSITGENYKKYSDQLAPGTISLLKKYPSYRLDVYPTHRTAGAPTHVYESTAKAATQAKLTDDKLSFTGAWAGVPFPIPQNGNEAIWNHLVHPRPLSYTMEFSVFVGRSDGKRTLASRGILDELFSYYDASGDRDKYDDKFNFIRFNTVAPSFKAGEAVVVHESLDMSSPPQAWQYMVGQRRVRRTPTISYDTPDFMVSGTSYFDELNGFRSRLDRYDWTLVGKQEMYVPYNNNRFFSVGEDKAFVPYHTNSENFRWELHRVWVIEATLADGKRHAVPTRRFYIDEDSWSVLVADGYDADGKLWRTSQVVNMIVPGAKSLASNATLIYNLFADTMAAIQYVDNFKLVPPRSTYHYSGDALINSSAR